MAMKLLRSRAIWGVLLVVMGLLFLLESLNILALGAAWAVMFAAAGLAFGYTYLENRENWWAIIPAMTLLGIAILSGVSTFFPRADEVGIGIFLGMLALSFWIIALTTRMAQWWAIIPGGVLLALAVAIALEPLLPGEAFVGIFMLGMSLTFGAVYLLPVGEGRMTWALIPAGILGLIGIIFLAAATRLAALIWPIALILVGGFLLLRSLRR